MPIFVALAVYLIRIVRRPMDVRLKRRYMGPLVLAAVAVVIAELWVQGRPAGISGSYFWASSLASARCT